MNNLVGWNDSRGIMAGLETASQRDGYIQKRLVKLKCTWLAVAGCI